MPDSDEVEASDKRAVPIIGAKLWPGLVNIAALPKKNADAETYKIFEKGSNNY